MQAMEKEFIVWNKEMTETSASSFDPTGKVFIGLILASLGVAAGEFDSTD